MSDWKPEARSGLLDSQKWLRLLKNPYNGTQLTGKYDWLYGVVGAAFGVVGFVCWVWAVETGFKRSVSIFGDLVFSSLVGSSPGFRFLWLGVVSIVVLMASLALIGNRVGRRKRSWAETVASQGGAQVVFGAGYLANAVIALVLWKLSLIIMAALLMSNLTVQVGQAADLHEVDPQNKFVYTLYSLAVYIAVTYILVFML